VAGLVAWMRMMGVDSVAYHEHTVAGRGDDPVAAALDYYASRGETPMMWGGAGAGLLGLEGEVDLADWRAVFAPAGAHHPGSGSRLVSCRRPGLELVVSPHKSVAELGVIGRAEDMHQIADAERDATLGYLDRLVREAGGRRGRAGVRTQTGGLTWATSRHATTRAGDPQVHDHVLIANVVAMGDRRGGWKALDTAFLRDHLHAATSVGRMAGAAKAVELGYGIVPDPGRSGRLGSWAIAGIPAPALELHSSRQAQIDAAVGVDASARSRAVAARATRDHKTHTVVEDLVGRWRHELTAAGYPPAGLEMEVTRAGLEYQRPGVELLDGLAEQLLSPGGPLAQTKTFDRDQVIVAVAPLLHGLPVSILDSAVERVLDSDLAIPLPAVTGAAGPVWAAASVLEDEARIAALADQLARTPGPALDTAAAAQAVRVFEAEKGFRLTDTQRRVAERVLAGGQRLDVIVGVAGSGKTTTLAAVRAGYENAGHVVIGAATSGQAAQALAGAGIDSRTVASLSWALERQRLTLGPRHVLILDEAAMTTDVDLARLLGAVEAAGAKAVVVGDYHQLDAVGPGGALEAITARHPELVSTLGENLRQTDRGEAAVLDQLRAGSVDDAISWYSANRRIRTAWSLDATARHMIQAWAADMTAGRDSLLLAYRRDNVDLLNRSARQAWGHLGRLSGPALDVGDGRVFQAGDRLVALAPGPDRAWTTSQALTVTAVDPTTRTMTALTGDGQVVTIPSEYLGREKMGYGYAITAHRAQGATVDTAHVLADGGGRELAYVAMSRARGPSHVYLPTANPAAGVDYLRWEWGSDRRQAWTLQPDLLQQALWEAIDQRRALTANLPPDHTGRIEQAHRQLTGARADLDDLYRGGGRWEHHPAAAAVHHLDAMRARHAWAVEHAGRDGLGFLERRRAAKHLETTKQQLALAEQRWREQVGPHATSIGRQIHGYERDVRQLEHVQAERDRQLENNPQLVRQIEQLDRAIARLHQIERHHHIERNLTMAHDLERDTGLSL
jgi:conjugative relaxase-like TrwC/TraI family protein